MDGGSAKSPLSDLWVRGQALVESLSRGPIERTSMSRDEYDPQQHQIFVLERIADALEKLVEKMTEEPDPAEMREHMRIAAETQVEAQLAAHAKVQGVGRD